MIRRSIMILILCLAARPDPLFGQSTAHVPANLDLQRQTAPLYANAAQPAVSTPGEGRIDVRSYGAVGDGMTDDTAAIQAAIDAAPENAVITGHNATYLVSRVNLRSNSTLRDFRFQTKPYDGRGGHYYSPVTIGAYDDNTTRKNIGLINVHIDGNRTNQGGFASAEDGGRHGFRIIGPVDDLWIVDSSARYCASDGLCFYRGLGMEAIQKYDDGIKHRIYVVNCRFEFNRRHGASGEAVRGLLFVNCAFNSNGTDINGGATEGDRGCEVNQEEFGNGLCFEEYELKDWFGEITLSGCEFRDNARAGLLVYSGFVESNDPRFVIRGPIHLINCRSDCGIGSWQTAYEFTPTAGNQARGPYWRDVQLIRCTSVKGSVLFRAVDGGQIIGGSFRGDGLPDILLDHATRTVLMGLHPETTVYQDHSTILSQAPGTPNGQ